MDARDPEVFRAVYREHQPTIRRYLAARVGGHATLGNARNTTSTSEFTDAEKLTLDASTEHALRLASHPGAKRTVRGEFDDSQAR